MNSKTLLLFTILMAIFFSAKAQEPTEMKPNTRSFNESDITFTEPLDSLRSKRSIFSTALYQGEVKLRRRSIIALYEENTLARRHYRLGQTLQPVGPLVSLAGIALGFIALKGTHETATIDYENQNITVDYIVRSRAKLAAGLGLFVTGIALIEFSNELVGNSVREFNSWLKGTQSGLLRPTFHYGVTPTGNIGLYARF